MQWPLPGAAQTFKWGHGETTFAIISIPGLNSLRVLSDLSFFYEPGHMCDLLSHLLCRFLLLQNGLRADGIGRCPKSEGGHWDFW